MEMRAMEDIAMAEDLIPPLPPLAFCLHDSFLATHCTACSLPLPGSPFSPTFPPNSDRHACSSVLYCSPRCSAFDSPLHFSSSEHNLLCLSPSPARPPDSSNIRLSLRLLNLFFQSRSEAVGLVRIGGLLTNYEKLVTSGGNDGVGDDDDALGMIKEGAAKMVSAGNFGDDMAAVAEVVMCLVLTNAAEVQDKNGKNVGIAVYGGAFSWINHSCSPNACYRFTAVSPEMDSNLRLRIYPAAMDCGGATAGAAGDSTRSEGCCPRIMVRSIKEIKKDEKVTIAYTDLLQPKELRQAELLAKYQFSCCCKRCRATPATYVDRALQALLVCSPDGHDLISDDNFYKSNEAQKLLGTFDDALDEYLRFNNPETCCVKLDELLTHGYLDEQPKPEPEKSQFRIRLHRFHHLSLNAYTTLASAYRVLASDFPGEALTMSRISAAYSLLAASLTHHLFLTESSLIGALANFWVSAGESLVCLSRSCTQDTVQNLQPSISENRFNTSHKCYQIVQQDGFEDKYLSSEMFAEISSEFLNCVANIAEKVWNFLTQESHHLNEIKNLIDFRGLLLRADSFPDLETNVICDCHGSVPRFEGNEHPGLENMLLFHLGIHCLVYGGYISVLCFGKQSSLVSDVVNFLYNEGIFSG